MPILVIRVSRQEAATVLNRLEAWLLDPTEQRVAWTWWTWDATDGWELETSDMKAKLFKDVNLHVHCSSVKRLSEILDFFK